MDKALVLADRLKKLKDQVDSLATKQTEIQTIKGDQGPKGDQGDRGFDGAPGLDGRDGKDGKDGADGKDGVSVVKAEIAFDGSLVLYLSNGDQIDCGEVTPEKSKEVFQTIKNSGGSSPIDIFTAVLPGLVPASGGGTTNFLRADGTFAAPPATAPASPTTSIQFNNAGAFGGSANFTYNTGTNTLNVGPANATSVIRAANTAAVSTVGGQITLQSGNGTFTGTTGGTTIVKGGDGTTVGGTGGSIQMNGGVGYTNGGNVELAAGFAFSGSENGANFTATGGQRNVSGGALIFESGGGNVGSGGGISFSAGTSANAAGGSINFALQGGATDDGEITFKNPAGETYAYFKNDGPGGAQQIGFFNATPAAKPAPTASGTQAVLDSVVSSLNSLGLVDSAALTNATVITPAGANTQIQYNNAGALGASANFTFNSTTNTVTLGATTGTATYTTRIPTTAQNPIALVVAAQNSIRTAGTSFGGALTLRSGNAGTTGGGGAINITSGNGGTTSGNGGAITILGGSATSGTGGNVTVQAGSAAALFLTGGDNSNGNGGDITGRAGNGAGAGVANGGSFTFTGGTASGALGGDGGSLFFRGGGGSGNGAGGNGGFNTFANGTAGTAANSDGNVFFYLSSSAGAPGSILLNSSFSTPAIEITKNAGTSATEIGFFNAAPVTQPTTATGSAAFVVNSGATIHPTSTFDGYTLAQVVRALRDLGILA